MESMCELGACSKPKYDNEYLSWPVWHDNSVRKFIINKLKNKIMVADFLDEKWNIIEKKN